MYSDFFSSGDAFYAQLTTLFGIAAGILLWYSLYQRWRIWKTFLSFALFPLLLWIVFGTLDITITTRCAYLDPSCEGNLASRWFFGQFAFFGGALASLAWISLWAGIMAAFIKYKKPFVVLVVLYSLAIGHLLGFSTWLEQLKALADIRHIFYPYAPLPSVVLGTALAILQTMLFKPRMRKSKRQR
ncbi:MAG TPA: hypothetical protein VJH24_04360 [Candidatus Bilamarchaeaceae archaeon]|nr:hypothetical protein [Candidatus Bilamarchaeaceae archaeon]